MKSAHKNLFTNIVLVALGSAIAYAFAVIAKSAVVVDGNYLPFGNDAFYHARRILDAISNGGVLQQFDSMMHVPEGSWVSWPWGFDRLLALIAQIGMALSPATDPMKILVYVPVAWIPINVALMLGIFRSIDLRPEFCALGIAGFALSPLTQNLHRMGAIDHHFMELTFVLLTVLLLLRWMSRPASTSLAVTCGLSLGLAQIIHHGLFILQLPVLATLFVLWVRASLPDVIAIRSFSGALLVSTLLLALPSETLRDGQFSMATFSWFHVYIAFCSAAVLTAMTLRPFSTRILIALGFAALVLAIPMLSELLRGANFLTGRLLMLDQIIEMKSPMAMIAGGWGLIATLGIYSGLLLLTPLLLAGSAFFAINDKRPLHIAFCIFSFFGLGLLLMQYRLNYFGLCFLLSGPLYFLSRYSSRESAQRSVIFLVSLAVFGLAYRLPLSGPLLSQPAVGSDHLYAATQPLYPVLKEACQEAPGVVAAAPQFGHYIRFHTECSVIANNFLLTDQHSEKVQLANSLFYMPANEVVSTVPEVRYILAFLADAHEQRDGVIYLRDINDIRSGNPLLINQLMLSDEHPEEIEVLHEIFIDPENYPGLPLAGIYRIQK